MTRAAAWLRPVAQLLFPPLCPVNGEPVSVPGTLSAEGWARLQFLAPPGCALCGAPFELPQPPGALCVTCTAPKGYDRALCAPGRLDGLRAAVVYDDASAALVLALKYSDRHDIAPALGRLMVPAFRLLEAPPGAVLAPVPLHRRRLRERRFNQASLLAQAVGRETANVFHGTLLQRIKATPRQKGLSVSGRFRNIAGAFQATDDARGRDVVLVDDVLTSGATLVGCARALRKAGAKSVRAVTFARVFPETKETQVRNDEF